MTNVTELNPITDGACRALGLAIIHQALQDLTSENETDKDISIFRDAYRWFFLPNIDFSLICTVAGRDALAVRKRAREVQNNPSLLGQFHA
jgi:hypothetical protein